MKTIRIITDGNKLKGGYSYATQKKKKKNKKNKALFFNAWRCKIMMVHRRKMFVDRKKLYHKKYRKYGSYRPVKRFVSNRIRYYTKHW